MAEVTGRSTCLAIRPRRLRKTGLLSNPGKVERH